MITTIDFRIGNRLYPVKMAKVNRRIYFKFGFNRKIMEEIKAMHGAQWHGFKDAPNRETAVSVFKTDKIWSIMDSERNRFQLEYLQGGNPYKRWEGYEDADIVLPEILRSHQCDWLRQGLIARRGIWAGEMGTGKTLPAIKLMEMSGFTNWWYVGPKSAIKAVERELQKWESKVFPRMLTYNALTKAVENIDTVPQGLLLDESQRVKTPTAQRSKAARVLAGMMRELYPEPYIILMTGSPAPRSPLDWWHQCEIVAPGFLREGSYEKFKLRMALHESCDSLHGGSFLSRVSWYDDEAKCKHCAQYKADHFDLDHQWEPSVNEVAKLYRRMKGLTIVWLKKDCLDLPDKIYREVNLEPLPSTVRAAKLIARSGQRAASVLTLLRELSDGFQYSEKEEGEKKCNACTNGKVNDFKLKSEFANDDGLPPFEEGDDALSDHEYQAKYYDAVAIDCHQCDGTGTVPGVVRTVERVPSPKDDALRELLDEHRDVGRLVVYAGFTASVDRCVEIAQSLKWAVIKWDGKGIKIYDHEGRVIRQDVLSMFQDDFENHPRVCFIGNAAASGTGLTLTASPTIVYYSNSFQAEDRIQSEDRIHRIGMDEQRGATIVDLLHLPSDTYVLNNLKKKRRLQDISMGELQSIFGNFDNE